MMYQVYLETAMFNFFAYYKKRGEELIREAHLEKYSQRFN